MRSNFAQTTLASVLAVVTVVLLVVAGFLARVVMEGDAGLVQRIASPEVTETADPATPAGADVAPDQRIVSVTPACSKRSSRSSRRISSSPTGSTASSCTTAPSTGSSEPSVTPTESGYIDPQTARFLPGTVRGVRRHWRDGGTQGDYVVIVHLLPGTPAERAGLRAGDVIVAVDGEDADRWSVEHPW